MNENSDNNHIVISDPDEMKSEKQQIWEPPQKIAIYFIFTCKKVLMRLFSSTKLQNLIAKCV